ncbi:hypothetical protein Q4566_02120 [Tamlana sp. 2_MG-2023]|uniref:toxin-antitoxin system YwqK family antitoxin n=1 Tax=unclassified Tamlana TaxID=2614803 RepID=UPI0026E209EC|nr:MULTISPECIES: hypothetical protein [unclassified Tamlana]MDO6758982.1 hypothetical protein [Tamlana sp. 2_MG-2023]MDO6789681.1 hypothetical protein [Tamlana sp. 1_MG-2023]
MKKILILLLMINSFLVLAQRIAPEKPNNLTFSHLIIKKEDNENGKTVYLRKSNNRPLDSEEIFDITETYPNDESDMKGLYIHTSLIKKGLMSKGYKTGLWKTYYKSKLVKTQNWKLGLAIGEYSVYDVKGCELYKTTFGNSGEGKFKDYYYETGALKEEGSYKNGKKEGKWCEYDKDGNVITTIYYESGVSLEK